MIRQITPERPLKILGFTDTHIGDLNESNRWTLRLIRETILAEQPDLIVFVGDNATGSEETINVFTACMTELSIPWCPIFGNHEGEHTQDTNRKRTAELFRQSPNCLLPKTEITTADGHSLFGHTNHAVPLYNHKGEVCHKLIFLDGGNEMSPEDKKRLGMEKTPRFCYDYLKEEQIRWYREEMQRDNCISMVFCHIPLPEFRDAIAETEPIFGAVHEGICSPIYNSGMFRAMLEENKTVAYIAGHDHVNDFHILHHGIRLMYNRASGLSAYNTVSQKVSDRAMLGCTVYTVDVNGHVTFHDLLYEELFPQYRDTIYRVMRK